MARTSPGSARYLAAAKTVHYIRGKYTHDQCVYKISNIRKVFILRPYYTLFMGELAAFDRRLGCTLSRSIQVELPLLPAGLASVTIRSLGQFSFLARVWRFSLHR